MLNFISLIIFLHVIPRAFSMENILRLAFLNYQNIIRCDDTQIQYYYGSIETPALLRVHLKCDSKDDIFDNYYHGYVWDTIELECSSDKQYVHERISIIWKLRGLVADIYKLPDPIARILNSNELYNLTRMREKENSIVFQSNEQLVENLFGNPQKRNIFLSFPNYPIMCCLSYDIKPDWSCDNEPVQIIDKTIICYYNPTDNKEPSVEQWLAEVRQFMDAERPKDKDSYVLNLPKPVNEIDRLESVFISIFQTITDDNKQDQSSNMDNIIDGQRIPNVDPYKKADDKKKKQSPMKKAFVVIIIIALSIVALLAIIGGVLFVLLKKKNKESSLPSEQLEKGDSNTSSSTVAESVKSSENDEIKTKQNIAAQKTDPNKRKRRGVTMQFMEDE